MRLGICFTVAISVMLVSGALACVESSPEDSTVGIVVEIVPCLNPIKLGQEFHFELKITNATSDPIRLLRDLG